MSSGWGCSHQQGESCVLLTKPCEPGMKGCVLYGKVLFSHAENPSNAAYERRTERDKERTRQQEIDDVKGF